MKILQVVQFFSPNHGGSATSTYELSKQLQKKGHEITVLTTDFQMNNIFIDSLEGIKVIPFHCQLNIGSLLISSSMDKYLNENIDNFDIIHMHNFRTYQNIITHKYAVKYNIPYILQARGSIPLLSKSKQKKVFDLLFGQTIVRDASKIIASSKIESGQYHDVFPNLNPNKIIHIPNGINLNTYSNLPKKGNFKKKYSIHSNEKIVLFLSRIHERKGADILTEAFFQLKNDYQNVKLVFSGPDDGYLNILKSIVKKHDLEDDVVFTGSLQGTEKLEAYIDADIFVLPSKDKYESFGNVILEACASGTPVVITDNCGAGEWIGFECGYIVKADAVNLKNAILNLLTDEETAKKFGENGRKLVQSNLSYEKIITAYEKLYTDLVIN